MYSSKDLELRDICPLELGYPKYKPEVAESVFVARKQRLIEEMLQRKLDAVVIYADREHYANFKYYFGHEPRFEEALLVVHADGSACCALGNECYSLANVPIFQSKLCCVRRFRCQISQWINS